MGSFFIPKDISESQIESNITLDSDADIFGDAWKGEWSSGATYTKEDIVRQNIELYESAVDGNTGNDPLTTTNIESPKWIARGKINRLRMFDEYVNSDTTGGTDGIIVVISNCRADQIALFGTTGEIIKIEILDENNISQWIFENNNEYKRDVGSWYEYFFKEFPGVVRFDRAIRLPWQISPVRGEKIKISITGGDNTACGHCLLGIEKYLGETQWGPEIGRLFFGVCERDKYGRVFLGKGPTAKIVNCELRVLPGNEDYVDSLLDELLGYRLVFNLNNFINNQFGALIVYGFLLKHWEALKTLNYTIVRMDIEGLI